MITKLSRYLMKENPNFLYSHKSESIQGIRIQISSLNALLVPESYLHMTSAPSEGSCTYGRVTWVLPSQPGSLATSYPQHPNVMQQGDPIASSWKIDSYILLSNVWHQEHTNAYIDNCRCTTSNSNSNTTLFLYHVASPIQCTLSTWYSEDVLTECILLQLVTTGAIYGCGEGYFVPTFCF